jgi:DNA primase large subunit
MVSEELRRRFVKAESTLFRIRYDTDDGKERADFLNSRNFDWLPVRASVDATRLMFTTNYNH